MKNSIKFTLLLSSLLLASCDFISLIKGNDDEVTYIVSDKKKNYNLSDVYDDFVDNGGLTVYEKKGIKQTKLTKSDYTYTLKMSSGLICDPNEAFGATGDYKVSVSYNDKTIGEDTFKVNEKDIEVSDISLNASLKNLTIGNTFKLNATVKPKEASNKEVTWKSSISSVASVDEDGLVTALKEGSTTITATSVSNTRKTATCQINVEKGTALVTGISFNAYSVTINKGDTFKLTATISPSDAANKSLDWSSNNNTVATVSDGIIVAKEKGNATITAAAKDGSGKKATCEVKVEDVPTVSVTSVSLDYTKLNLVEGNNYTLVATVSPSNATNKNVVWSSSDTSVATVSNGTVKALKEGTATITVKSAENTSKTATCAVTVSKTENQYEQKIVFNSYYSDDSTQLTSDNFDEVVKSGSSYFSYKDSNRAYKGKNGLKIGSSSNYGYISLYTNDLIKIDKTTKIVYETIAYGNDDKGTKLFVNDATVASYTASSAGINICNFTTPKQVESLKIQSNKRVYVSWIAIETEPVERVNPTAISLPTSKEMTIGSVETLVPTYMPTECNQNKSITWTSSNTSVASVNDSGLISALAEGKTTITATLDYDHSIKATCEISVKAVPVSGITLDNSTLNLSIGKTQTLTATVLPENATNKNVSWSSSNQSVATVSNDGLVTAIAEGTTTIKATTEDGNKVASCVVTVSKEVSYSNEWTILIYMCGADLESDYANTYDDYGERMYGCATEDLMEIASVSNQPSDVNVVVQAGGAKTWDKQYSSVLNSSYSNRFYLKNKNYTKISQTTKINMGLESTFESFLEWGLKTYPANNVGVILWNHGGGMSGACFDEQFNDDGLTPKEQTSAFKTALNNSGYGKNLAFIGYDCCLMQIQDIASLHADYADYMVGSEESEWGYGWSYDYWIPKLFSKKSTTTILDSIVDGFGNDTSEAYDYWGDPNDQTLSYLDLSKWDTYETAFEDMANYLSTNVIKNNSNWNTFANTVNSAQKFGYYNKEYGYPYDVFDIGSVISKMKTQYSSNSGLITKLNTLSTAYSSLVKKEFHGSGASGASGLTLFCPISGYNGYSSQNSEYQVGNTNLTIWRSLVVKYGSWYN